MRNTIIYSLLLALLVSCSGKKEENKPVQPAENNDTARAVKPKVT